MWLSWGKKQQSSGGAQQTQRLSGQVGGGELAGKDDTTIKLNRSSVNPPNTDNFSLLLQSSDKQVSTIHLITTRVNKLSTIVGKWLFSILCDKEGVDKIFVHLKVFFYRDCF